MITFTLAMTTRTINRHVMETMATKILRMKLIAKLGNNI